MGSEERLSTRDIASPGSSETDETDPRFERDTVAAEAPATDPPPPTDAAAATGEPPATEPAAQSGAEAVAPVPTGGREETVDTVDTPAETDTRADAVASEAPAEPTADRGEAPLLDDSEGFQSRWEEIQVRFVDEPRGAVEDADALVATVMQRLAEGFAQEREHLEAQWGRGEDISTEDLRVALQRYRSFFRRLLAT